MQNCQVDIKLIKSNLHKIFPFSGEHLITKQNHIFFAGAFLVFRFQVALWWGFFYRFAAKPVKAGSLCVTRRQKRGWRWRDRDRMQQVDLRTVTWRNREQSSTCFWKLVPSSKLTVRHGKTTILMVFTRKDGDFHGRAVSFREGRVNFLAILSHPPIQLWVSPLSQRRQRRDSFLGFWMGCFGFDEPTFEEEELFYCFVSPPKTKKYANMSLVGGFKPFEKY